MRKEFLPGLPFVLAAALLSAHQTRAGTTVTNGLAAHLTFDDKLTDSSANKVDGTAVGNPTFAAGILGKAVHVVTKKDGSVNDYVSLGYADALRFGDGATASDFSFSFWAKVTHQSDDQPFIGNKDWLSGGNKGWVIATEGDGMKWNFRDDGGSGRRDSPHVARQVVDGNWHQIAVTFVRTNTAKIYVDGALVDTSNIAPDAGMPVGSVDTDDRGGVVNIGQDGTGAYTDSGAAEIDLLLDDLGIWKRALTSDEVAEIYNKGLAGKTLDLELGVLPTAILTQPATNITVVAGLRASFAVKANGAQLGYQWRINGTDLPGATNDTYTIDSTTTASAGTYTVVVKGQGGTVTSNPAKLTVTPAPANCSVTSGLIAHLKFDGDYSDASGNGITGAAVGTPTFEKGILGQAIHITNKKDGSVNNYVTLGYPSQLKFGADTTASDVSFAFWVKIFHQADDQAFIGNKDWNSGANFGFVIASEGDGMKWNFRDTGGSGRRDSPHVEKRIEDGNWHHIAVSFERKKTGTIYVDGVLADSSAIAPDADKPVGSFDTDDLGMKINVGQDGTGTYTDGGAAEIDMLMDDLSIWKRVLTPDEVVCLYTHGLSGKAFDETLAAPTVIATQPANAAVVAGLGASFRVAATGQNLSYQWKLNGADLAGATNSTYVIASASAADAGVYTVVVTGLGGVLTSSPATLTLNPAPSSPALGDGLLVHLKFDGDYTDASGNGVAGVAVGAPAFENGIIGKAVHLISDGVLKVNNYVTLGYPSALKLGTNDFSAAFWVKINSQNDDKPFVSNKDWNSGGNPGFVIATEGDGMKWNLRDHDKLSDRRDSPHVAPQLLDKNWHHVAVTFQRASFASIYVDGTLVNTNSVAPNPGKPVGSADTDDLGFKMNLGQDGTGKYTDGGNQAAVDMLMDDFALWRRALTSDEVVAIVSHGRAGNSFDTFPSGGIQLQVRLAAGQVNLSWSAAATLQSADSVTGPWSDVTGASSPYSTTPKSVSKFYRLKQ